MRSISGILLDKPNILYRAGLVNSRVDLIAFFSRLVRDPTALLRILLDADTHFSGSIALEYFRPGSTSTNSDWEFYYLGSPIQVPRMKIVHI